MSEPSPIYLRIAKRCEELGISTSYMCDCIGCRRGLITELKNKEDRALTSFIAINIADYLKISIDYLLTGRDYNSSVSQEEEELIHAYRRASIEEKENIKFLLRRYMSDTESGNVEKVG